MRQIFLERADDPGHFEEVDEYTYVHQSKARLANGTHRYSGNQILVNDDGNITVQLSNVTPETIGVVHKLTGDIRPSVRPETGWTSKPETIYFAAKTSRSRPTVRINGKMYSQV